MHYVAEVTVSETLVETVLVVVVVTVPLEVVDLLGVNTLTKMVLVGDPKYRTVRVPETTNGLT